MSRDRRVVAVTALALVSILAAPACSREARTARPATDAIGELAAPTIGALDTRWSPMDQQFAITPCESVEQEVGERLLYLDDSTDFGEVQCFLEPKLEPNHWGPFVVYPTDSATFALGFTDFVEAGGLVIGITLDPPRVFQPPPDSDQGNPKSSSGGYKSVSLRGTRGVVQRDGEHRYRVSWSESFGQHGEANFSVMGGVSGDAVYERARTLRRGS